MNTHFEVRHVTSPNTTPPRSVGCGHAHRTEGAAKRCAAKQRTTWRREQGRKTLPEQWVAKVSA